MNPVGTAIRALNDAPECGDACGHWEHDGKIVLCLVDGLGHGGGAMETAQTALHCVAANLGRPLDDVFQRCDGELRGTRGAAMSIALIDKFSGTLTYAGIGNVNLLIGTVVPRRFCNTDGIVGGGFRRLIIETGRLAPGDTVIMFSDGLQTEIDLEKSDCRGIRDSQKLAECLLENWRRGTDDAAVLTFLYEAA